MIYKLSNIKTNVIVSMITSLTLVHLIQLNAHVGSLHFLDNVDQMVVQLDIGTSLFSLYKTLSEGVFCPYS